MKPDPNTFDIVEAMAECTIVKTIEVIRCNATGETRAPGCQCHLAPSDSPCPVHGEDSP